jgi:hypothetical protein
MLSFPTPYGLNVRNEALTYASAFAETTTALPQNISNRL